MKENKHLKLSTINKNRHFVFYQVGPRLGQGHLVRSGGTMVPRGKGSHLKVEGILEKSPTIQSQWEAVVRLRTVCNSSLFQVLTLWISQMSESLGEHMYST